MKQLKLRWEKHNYCGFMPEKKHGKHDDNNNDNKAMMSMMIRKNVTSNIMLKSAAAMQTKLNCASAKM